MATNNTGQTYTQEVLNLEEIDTVDELLAKLREGYHPGAVLGRLLRLEDIRESTLADEIELSRAMISQIVSNGRRITPETAHLLGAFFSRRGIKATTEDWAHAQLKVDLRRTLSEMRRKSGYLTEASAA